MLRIVFILEALLDFFFGIALIVATGQILGLYGIATDEAGTFLGHFLAATFIGFGLINWFARAWADSEPRRLIVRVNFVTTALGLAATVVYQLQPGTSPRVWAIVLLTTAFTVAWGWFALNTYRQRG